METPQFFTIDETAKILRISKVTVHRKLLSGEIKSTHLGKRVLIPASFFAGLAAEAWSETAAKLPEGIDEQDE
jgi:excisionase family DNA binding protein